MIVRANSFLLSVLAAIPAWAVDTRASDSSRPRGVGPEFAKFYRPSSLASDGTFTCLSNPSHSIPFSQINDDYCDCPDGSDEPGTAACSYLSHLSPRAEPPADPTLNTTLALPGFYCKNKGHIPAYIRFESVNDGRCDYDICCDGSDEWQSVGGISCPDKCKQIGADWKKADDLRQKSVGKATQKRKELQTTAARLRLEVEHKIADLEIKINGYEVILAEASAALAETSKNEKYRVVRPGTSTGGGKLSILLGVAKQRVDELRTTLLKTTTQRDAMVLRVNELETILSTFKDEHNPNFNDDGVKRAVRAWEDYAARETDDGWDEASDRDLDEISKEDSADTGVHWAEFESAEDPADADVKALYQFTSYLPPSLRDYIDSGLVNLRQLLVENGILAHTDSGAGSLGESKAMTDARKLVADAERDVSDTRNEQNNQKEDLGKDYGPEGIFRALRDVCVSKDSGEYVYELCLMNRVLQKPKKGGGDVNMGNFERFETEVVDEEVGLDGRGLGKGERVVMVYEGAALLEWPQSEYEGGVGLCRGGEVWRVSESEKCVYRMEVGTPAVCGYTGKVAL